MKITKIEAFQTELPQAEGDFSWAGGLKLLAFESTLVALHTDVGIVGYGEVVPHGSAYLPAYSRGVITGLEELAPHLIGAEISQISTVNELMDMNLKGHPYVKAPIDMACWDALGKLTKQPLATLLGGRMRDSVIMYKSIPQRSAQGMADLVDKYMKQGYTKFQLKIGSSVQEDAARIRQCRTVLPPDYALWADANAAWTSQEAIRVANAVKDVDVIMEQPCPTREGCNRVRKRTNLPFLMDEAVQDIESILDVWKDGIADIMSIKISKFGGVTKMKHALDLGVALGIPMVVDDTWGADFNNAAIIHLASTIPEKFHFASTDLHNYNTVHTGSTIGGEVIRNGRIFVPTAPGLGIEPNWGALGQPVFTYPRTEA